ncbi:MAG: hypothetical protein IKS29_04380 [Oscillospiraceae bacterium]|nr:hypothetical protein [Oscillospiraceae bacterium]
METIVEFVVFFTLERNEQPARYGLTFTMNLKKQKLSNVTYLTGKPLE